MSLQVLGRTIDRVAIVDDESSARKSYELTVEDLSLTPVSQDGPLEGLNQFLERLLRVADAALCDHHLQVRTYAGFNGADLVAQCYRQSFPALLCTTWNRASLDEMRGLRRFIPVMLNPKMIEPDTIRSGFVRCMEEFREQFSVDRRPWRALVRVVEAKEAGVNSIVYVVVPSWDSREVVPIVRHTLPDVIQRLAKPGARFHAQVNLGAESYEELYLDQWEQR